MRRRSFLEYLGTLPALAIGAAFLPNFGTDVVIACDLEKTDGIKTFGFYQGLGPNEIRSSNRPDGTDYKMPCITRADVELGESKAYEFWHGHGNQTHHFTVTEDHFVKLANSEAIEIYTDVIQGHRHALKIEPDLSCSVK